MSKFVEKAQASAEAGFTLIGILAAIAIPQYEKYITSAKASDVATNFHSAITAATAAAAAAQAGQYTYLVSSTTSAATGVLNGTTPNPANPNAIEYAFETGKPTHGQVGVTVHGAGTAPSSLAAGLTGTLVTPGYTSIVISDTVTGLSSTTLQNDITSAINAQHVTGATCSSGVCTVTISANGAVS